MSPVTLPHAVDEFDEIERHLRGRQVALFLDYDGTLTPIVERPELAILSTEMRRVVATLAAQLPVAIVSGRDRADVEQLVGLDSLYYAGSHGFDISGPDGLQRIHPAGNAAAASLDRATNELGVELKHVDGALIERKRFAVAVHFRLVAAEHRDRVRTAFEDVASRHSGLRVTGGKCVYELRPDVAWGKGFAVQWLLELFAQDAETSLPCYIGDDETDEDAFAVVADRGIGILVAEEPPDTKAQYYLRSPMEVKEFLQCVHRVAPVI
ncbi:MAG: trehalose-phosphatase [Gemmatimonadota bacterium]|nr:trehalose-phosphatase [Gemmatimonadota bacterium]